MFRSTFSSRIAESASIPPLARLAPVSAAVTVFLFLCMGPPTALADAAGTPPATTPNASGPTPSGSIAADREANDVCAGATILESGGSGHINGDLTGYTNDYDPAVPGPSCTGHAAAGKDLVLAMDLHCAEWISIQCRPVGFDASIYIVTDCSDISGSCVAGADEGGMGESEFSGIDVVFGGRFYIIVDARGPDEGGSFELYYSCGVWDIPPGACCFPDGHCEFMHPDSCHDAGGDPHVCLPCEPNPCVPTPTVRSTWGSIKSRYF